MNIPAIPMAVTTWAALPASEHPGETGTSFWRTFEAGGLRVRMVDYSPGFKADHWCGRGHILIVLDGEISVRLKDGREHHLTAGMSFQAGDDETNPHLARSDRGARVFIVD
jgi:quercetin dioxygenase-like cupin family protein